MIEQYLSNTNESAIVSILQKILERNKARSLVTVSTAFITVFNTLQSLYIFTRELWFIVLLEVASLLTPFLGRSVGFTMKPFKGFPNKFVAARFPWQGL